MVTFLIFLFVFAFIIQAAFFLFIFLPRKEDELLSNESLPVLKAVSVVICAHNERTNLSKNLPLILEQDHPDYEVVVVDDRSTDGTAELLEKLSGAYPALKWVQVKNTDDTLRGKKYPLSIGIAKASNDLLVLTDADCRPVSRQWLALMSARMNGPVQAVTGYAPYEKRKGFLNKCIRFETIYAAIQYLQLTMAGVPYMSTGRNLGYHRDLYEQNNGFTEYGHLLSGDDDLFINRVANAGNVEAVIDPGSFVYSTPMESWLSWLRQKYRHLSTGAHYRFQSKLLLGLLNASHVIYYLNFLILLSIGIYPGLLLTVFGLRLLIIFSCFSLHMKRLREEDLIPFIPLLDVLYVVYLLINIPAVFFNKNRAWH